jgi:hypothetical protein
MPVVINKTTQERALVDSGASDNFIHQETARSLGLKLQKKKEPQAVNDIQGRNLGWISHYVTVLLEAAHHQEEIDLNVVPLGIHGLVVGLPWLQKHNPDIEWREKRIKFSSPFCKWKCIKKAYERLRDDKGKFTPRKDQVQLEDTNGTEHMELDAILPNSTEHHGSEQHESMKGVPAEYHDFADVFNLEEARTMPKDRGLWNFKINFIEGWEDKLPKPARRYRLSADEQKLEQETIKELLAAGMIRPSTSPIAAPCFFVPKKDGTKRHVVDWRGINAITVKDAHPLPIMDDLLDLARGSKIMSKLDLTASYNQIPIREKDRWKTAFITSQGLFEFNVMHFGFANAPPHMQRFMQHTLAPVFQEMVRVYLDDIPVFSLGTSSHIATMRRVFELLRKNKLYAKAKKCEFHQKEMELLGIKVTTDGFEMEDKKITEVRQWKPPKNVKGVRSFLGFCNFYRRFIKNFSLIARPLHDLEQKNHPWRWTEKEQTAFEKLKELVTEKPVLAHINPSLPFRMETDASNTAYGAVLSQKQPDGTRHPVAYMSKSMTPPERNYDIGDKEALGIIKPLQHWRHWLEATKEPIEILTDHKNLVNFSNPKILNQRQARWLQALQRFNYLIGYRPGTKNSAADALSRREELAPSEQPKAQTLIPKNKFIELKEEYHQSRVLYAIMTDASIWEMVRLHFDDHPEDIPDTKEWGDLLPLHQGRLWVPPDRKIWCKILQLYHDSPISGHQGVTGTEDLVSRGYYWPKMNEYIEDYVKGCKTCQMAKRRISKLTESYNLYQYQTVLGSGPNQTS